MFLVNRSFNTEQDQSVLCWLSEASSVQSIQKGIGCKTQTKVKVETEIKMKTNWGPTEQGKEAQLHWANLLHLELPNSAHSAAA